MKKVFILGSSILIIMGLVCYLGIGQTNPSNSVINALSHEQYVVKKGSKEIGCFKEKEKAIKMAKQENRAIVVDNEGGKWIYNPFEPFLIINKDTIHDFERIESALAYAKKNDYTEIYYKDNQTKIWQKDKELKKSVILDVPLILQYPELARGCEVTSLTMLLKHRGHNTDKIKLAKEIKKDNTPYSKDGTGKIAYGNPYNGFVGDMYSLKNNGYGVYHGPIFELASAYAGEKVIDLTGLEFEEIMQFVEAGNPIWVIINATYRPLDESYFEMWHTPTGIVKVTKKLHSVVVTGYDEKNIYINDPLHSSKNRKANKNQFKKAWEQMGKQAVVILK